QAAATHDLCCPPPPRSHYRDSTAKPQSRPPSSFSTASVENVAMSSYQFSINLEKSKQNDMWRNHRIPPVERMTALLSAADTCDSL
ncbi:hypothetical protein Prudu_008510, partial [Prunus dulcis]